MSVIWSNEKGWIICHSLFLHKIYHNIINGKPCDTCKRYCVFHLNEPFLKRGQKNYCRRSNEEIETSFHSYDQLQEVLGKYTSNDFKSFEVCAVSILFETLMRDFTNSRVDHFFNYSCQQFLSNGSGNESAIEAAGEVAKQSQTLTNENFDGGNNNDEAITVSLKNQMFFIPGRCRFYNYDVRKIREKLNRLDSLYDLILIDPPWQNKHVRRKNSFNASQGYSLMNTDNLAELPIDDYLASDGLLAVWCTNSVRHVNSLIFELFARWKVQYIGTWFWIKVTQNAQPICEFSTDVPNRKQPYERIIFASRTGRSQIYNSPPPNRILISIPSSIHSHKPPLTEILRDYLPTDSKCLEIFARYLLPGWTSYGNEVLKLQLSSLYR